MTKNKVPHWCLWALLATFFGLAAGAQASELKPLSRLDDPNRIGHAPVELDLEPAHEFELRPGLPEFKICSKLDFSTEVSWPQTLTATDREALKLAFNISGSFEGSTGWANLTNDFDGMGLSMGLLNQTLGTGSLQPMLIKARDRYRAELNRLMSRANLDSLLEMLGNWENGRSGRNATSAQWARENIYAANGRFTSSWSRDLTGLTTSPEYISIQIEAGVRNHRVALSQQRAIGCGELRCYLLMYDFAVQNGGLYQEDIDDFKSWASGHADASLATKLKKLIELRVRHCRKEYMNDVRSRKLAIVNGSGEVHDESRALEREYCFDRKVHYPL